MSRPDIRDRRHGARNGARAAEVVVCALAVVLSSLLYLDFFATADFLPAVVAAVLVAATLAGLGTQRWSAIKLFAAACLGFVVVAIPALRHTMHHGLPTGQTASELAWGIAGGWARMLSVSLPAAVNGEMLVALLFISWVATYTAVILVFRTTSPLAPSVPPVLAFGIGLVMVASQQRTHLAITAVLAALVLALTLLRAHRGGAAAGLSKSARNSADSPSTGRGLPIRTLSAGVILGTVAITAGVAGGASGLLAAGHHRADPRPLYSVSLKNPEVITPLATVKAQLLEDPPRHLFSVRLEPIPDAESNVGIRVAALDHFDGALWTTEEDYLVAGQRLGRDPAQVHSRSVIAHITIDELPSPFLPVVGWPTQIRFPAEAPSAVGFNPTAGSLITEHAIPRGTAYELLGEYQSARDLPRQANPSTLSVDRRYLDVPPGLPPFVVELCHQLTDSDPSAVGKLAALEGYLRGLPYSLETPPGHSYAAISKLVGTVIQAHDDEGYAEQHAAAFAVMARALGYPARVAVGYRLQNPRNGTFEVTTRDAHAWAEVHFDDYGWVAFDPTDPNRTQRSTPPHAVAPPTPSPEPIDAGTRATPNTAPMLPPDPPTPPGIDLIAAIPLAVAALGALVMLVCLGVITEKARRRWRRRHARTQSALVLGAWEEAVDRLTEQRLSMAFSLTPQEVAEQAADRLGHRARAITDLAAPTTTAIFGPEFLTPDDGRRAWLLERSLRRDLYPGWRRWRRLGAWLNPRPLYARRATAKQDGHARRGRRRRR